MPKLSKLYAFVAGIALAAGLVTSAAFAKDATTLNVGTIVTYPPLEFKDPQTGKLTGFNHELLAAMAEKAGIKLNWIEFSWSDLASFAPLNTGRVDIYGGLMGDFPPRRAAGVNFLDYMYEPYYLYVPSVNADKFMNPTALCGKRVANTRSSGAMTAAVDKWSAENCAAAGLPAIEQLGANSTPDQQLMLKQGRVDAGYTGVGSLVQAKRSGGDQYTAIGKPLARTMYGFSYLERNSGPVKALQKALDELIADGSYEKLLEQWGLPIEDSSIGKSSLINAGE